MPADASVLACAPQVDMNVIKSWVAKRMVELMDGVDDDITIGMTHNLLDEPVRLMLFPVVGQYGERCCGRN